MQDTIEYIEVPYSKFVKALLKKYSEHKKKENRSEIDIAICIGKSCMTVRNCFNLKGQVVSDKIITSLMKCVDLPGKIEWLNGEKYFYLENN